jgi:hypothetical protein
MGERQREREGLEEFIITLTFRLLQLKQPFLDFRCGRLANFATLETSGLSRVGDCRVIDLGLN